MPTVTTRVAQTFKKPNIAESYGTFATLQAAMTYVENADIKCAGLTVGIDQPDGSIKEYWLQPIEGQLQFVEKDSDVFNGEVQATNAKRLQALANVSNQEAEYDGSTPPVFTGKMGYAVLQPEKAGDATTTFAAQIENKPNTIFEIRSVFDLDDAEGENPVTIPAGCTLKFNGGAIKNGVVNGIPYVEANANGVFSNVKVNGVANETTDLRWFLAEGVDTKDAIESACKCAHNSDNYLLDGANIEVTLLDTIEIVSSVNDCNMQNLNIVFRPYKDNMDMFSFSLGTVHRVGMTFMRDCTFEVPHESYQDTYLDYAYSNIHCLHFKDFTITTRGRFENIYVRGFSGYMFLCESFLQEIDFNTFKGSRVGGFVSFNKGYGTEYAFGDTDKGSSNILTFTQCGIDNGLLTNNTIVDVIQLNDLIRCTMQSCVFQGAHNLNSSGTEKQRNLLYVSGDEGQHTTWYGKFTANDCWEEFVNPAAIKNFVIGNPCYVDINGNSFINTITVSSKNILIRATSRVNLEIGQDTYPRVIIDGNLNDYTNTADYINRYKDIAEITVNGINSSTTTPRISAIHYNPSFRYDAKKALIDTPPTDSTVEMSLLSNNGVTILRQTPVSGYGYVYLLPSISIPSANWLSTMFRMVYRVYPIVEVTSENYDTINRKTTTSSGAVKYYGDGIANNTGIFSGAHPNFEGTTFEIGQSTDPEDAEWKEVITNFLQFIQNGVKRRTDCYWGIDIAVCEILSENALVDRSIRPSSTDAKVLEVPNIEQNCIGSVVNFTPATGELIGKTLFDKNLGKQQVWNGSAWVNPDGTASVQFSIDTTGLTSGITIDNQANSIGYGKPYLAKLSANGLDISGITVTMGGIDVTSLVFVESQSVIYIGGVVGDIVISGGSVQPRYLTFTANEANSSVELAVGGGGSTEQLSLQYSTDGITWNAYVVGTTGAITLENQDDKVMFKGVNSVFNKSNGYHTFILTGDINASGDVTALLNGVGGDVDLSSDNANTNYQYCFYNLFASASASTVMKTTPNLPSTKTRTHCYDNMFMNNAAIEVAPELPATVVTSYAYQNIFKGCSSLKSLRTKMTDISATNAINSWLYNVGGTSESKGSLYCDSSLTLTQDDASGVPVNWTRYNLDGTAWEDPNAE